MNFSRREFLAILAGGCGAAAACAVTGTGLAGLTYLWNRQNRRRVVVVTSTPPLTEIAAVPELTLIPHAEWGGLEPDHQAENETGFYSEENPLGWRVYEGNLADVYTTLVLHHSVIYEADDLSTMLEIQNLHRTDRKWADIGYHYLIGKDGTIYEGRPVNVRGVHVEGYNTGSVGVCLLGNFMEELPTETQLQAARLMIGWLTTTLQLSHLAPHRAFNANTLCPGDNLVPYVEEFAANNNLTIGTDGYFEPTPSAFRCSCQL